MQKNEAKGFLDESIKRDTGKKTGYLIKNVCEQST
jgi:hypothetical protein